ncbi:MAG TPA: hypothetical protein PLU37_14650 [Chitinophagaceae bacterium]|nr:hypothetical protein [Chitinophagaceae bacterium]HPG12770.1 hypothetical protein [Chitinophagaceae bacterium]HRX94555.1 hypothetical protein [Chitinophagaceae bacterium]
MQLIEVNSPSLAKEFIKVNVELNKNNPAYIRPLDKDINEVFDPKKNKTFRNGEVIRWILKDDSSTGSTGKLIGRIAAFTNKKYKNKGDDGPVGGIGFFDCINDQKAADMLFDVAKHWLMQKGMQAMDGPINFGERDRWWGLVVKGNELQPMYCMNFNASYYKQLFENYGFKNYFNQICFGMKASSRLQQKFYDRHAECAKDPGYSSAYLKKSELAKFAKDFTIIYNKAWAGHGGMKQLEEKVVLKMFQSMKPVMDERINWFIYYKDEPVGMWINLPDLNQWFKYLNGKFSLLHKLKFLWIKATKKNKKFTGLVFGIVPEHQGKGADSYVIVEGCKIIQGLTITDGNYEIGKPIYEDYEMQWIGEFNPKMVNVAEAIAGNRSRILTTYRYNFDRTKEFKPHPILH